MKLLVISDIAPGKSQTAGHVLENILSELRPETEISSIIIGNNEVHREFLNQIPNNCIYYTTKPHVDWTKGNYFINSIGQWFAWAMESRQIAQRAQALIDEIAPDYVLVACQCQVVSSVVARLEFREAKLVSIVWDEPSWWAESHGLNTKSAKRFKSEWYQLQNAADSLVLPSPEASELFEDSAKRKVSVLYPYLAERVEKTTAAITTNSRDSQTEDFRIAFLGQLYAYHEMNELIEKLARVDWRIGGKKIQLHVFGRAKPGTSDPNVKYRGFWEPKKLVEELSNFQAAFLPYPKSKKMTLVTRTSFPSKLAIYTAANLPVLYFGPEEAAVFSFIVKNDIGVSFQAERPTDIDLEELLRKKGNVKKAYDRYFSRQVFRESLLKIFNLEATYLVEVEKSRNGSPPLDNRRVRIMQWSVFTGDSHDVNTKTGPFYYWARISISKYFNLLSRPNYVAIAIIEICFSRIEGFLRKIAYAGLRVIAEVLKRAQARRQVTQAGPDDTGTNTEPAALGWQRYPNLWARGRSDG